MCYRKKVEMLILGYPDRRRVLGSPSYLRRGPNIYRQIDIDMYTISVSSDRQTDRQIIKLTDRQMRRTI